MQHFGVVYSAMQLKSDQIAEEVETAQRFNIDQGMFAKFLGLCVRMAMYCLPNRDNYWCEGWYDGVEYHFGRVMSRDAFRRIMRCLVLPDGEGRAPEASRETEDPMWGNVKYFAQTCFELW